MRIQLMEHLGILPIPLPDTGKYYYIHISRGNWGFRRGVTDLLLHAELQSLPWNSEDARGRKVRASPIETLLGCSVGPGVSQEEPPRHFRSLLSTAKFTP